MFKRPISHEAFQRHNVDRGVAIVARTSLFTEMVTDPPADGWERVIFFDAAISVGEATFADQGDVPLGALADRACVPARSHTHFFDRKGVGDGLWVRLVDGFTL